MACRRSPERGPRPWRGTRWVPLRLAASGLAAGVALPAAAEPLQASQDGRRLEQGATDFERWQRAVEAGAGVIGPNAMVDQAEMASIEQLLNRTMDVELRLNSWNARLDTTGTNESTKHADRNAESAQWGSHPPCSDLAAFAAMMQSGMFERSPAVIYISSFTGWLRDNPYQGCIAICAVVVGLLSAWDGPGVWHALFTTVIAAAGAGVARFELEAQDLVASQVTVAVLMAQAGAAVALATHSGFEGSQVFLGFCVGFAGAYGCGETARSWDKVVPGVVLVWYTSGAVIGVLVYTVWRRPVLAALGPLFGGLLVASGAGCLLSSCCAAFGWSVPPLLPPPAAPWFSASAALVGGEDFLAGHGVCALLALVVHGCSQQRRLPAVCILVGCVALTGLTAISGFECQRHSDFASCPSWLQSGGVQWQWPVFGCALWAGLTAAAAWRQFGASRSWEDRGLWAAYWVSVLGCGDYASNEAQVPRKSSRLREEQSPEEVRLLAPAEVAPASRGLPSAQPPLPPTATRQAFLTVGPAPPAPNNNQEAPLGPPARRVEASPGYLTQWLSVQQPRGVVAPYAPPGSGV